VPKTLTIIGSTGSIGTQALDIVRSRRDIEIIALAAGSKLELLVDQIKEFKPRYVSINSQAQRETLKELFPGIEVLDSVIEIAKLDIDVFLSAIVGIAGLEANLTAMQHARRVAVANKETLVAAGHLVNDYQDRYGSELIPVDSEHAAIAQALMAAGEKRQLNQYDDIVDHIILTSSGGPFRNREDFSNITVEEALKHPTWVMGPKITIDCSTLMNKGLEVIEAHQLFRLSYDKIKVVIHPQSIVHGAVQFIDGNMMAQLAPPDMRIPIQFAIDYPQRLSLGHCEAQSAEAISKLDLCKLSKLDFHEPDLEKFPALTLAYEAGRKGHSYPAVLNSANEAAVAMFLNKEIKFTQIVEHVEDALNKHKMIRNPSLEEILELNRVIKREAIH
jgi:1-deoxy-D-xylulose-5-phosphate reductoisomerase